MTRKSVRVRANNSGVNATVHVESETMSNDEILDQVKQLYNKAQKYTDKLEAQNEL